MARITPVEGASRSILLRVLNAVARRMTGKEPAPLGIVAHNPRFLLPYALTRGFVQGRTRFSPGVRSLATHLVAELNGCAWCIDYGRYEALRRGVGEEEKLGQVLDHRTSPLFTPAERAALAYTECVTQVGARVPDDVFAELARHYGEREIVELTLAVATENFYNRINAPLELESQGFCALSAPAAPSLARR